MFYKYINIKIFLQQFDVHIMLQFRYLDNRLKFSNIAPYLIQIHGGKFAHDLIWTPTVYVSNEPSSAIMGSGVKDILVSIDPSGMVILNTRFVNKTLDFFNILNISYYQMQY